MSRRVVSAWLAQQAGRPELDDRQNCEFDPHRTRRGHAKTDASEPTCDIFPLGEATFTRWTQLDWVLAGPIAANA